MMKINPVIINRSLLHRIRWLIKLRWLAAVGVLVSITVSKYIMDLELPYFYLYLANSLLFLYNLVFYFYNLKLSGMQQNTDLWYKIARVFTNIQITLDLTMLTYFIHLSGGPENPFIFYFIFHMVIASIILANRAAYIQATLAALLLGFVFIGERSGFLIHHHLGLFIPEEICFLGNRYFIITYTVFVTTLYISTYFATSIVNELREGEVELEKANEKLEEKDRLKSQYVKTVSHDLKSSLSTIQSCLNVVLNGHTGFIPEKSKEMVGRAEQRTRKLNHFVKELWSLSRMRVVDKIEKKGVPIFSVIENVTEQMKPFLEEKGLSLKVINRVGNPVVHVNDYMMEELLSNILDNAIKYSSRGKKITIKCEESEISGFIQISIKDEGIGIPHGSLSRVFDDFYRAENAEMVEKDGTGLGLSIVKQIIEMSGGKIWTDSTLNKGSTFTFTLPKE